MAAFPSPGTATCTTEARRRGASPHSPSASDRASLSERPPSYVLSKRFEKALDWAVDLHRDQGRKGSHTPYVGHLLGVAGYVLEDGGSEDEAIAALLHDAIEDRDRIGLTQALIAAFGEHVVAI